MNMPEWIGKSLVVGEKNRSIISDPATIIRIQYERKRKRSREGGKIYGNH